MRNNEVFLSRKKNVPYRQPVDFAGRNKALLSAVTRVMGGKSVEFSQFKQLSGQFRAGKLSCEEFYQCSLALVGDDRKAFMQFFPELLVLLPDINKQQVKTRFPKILVYFFLFKI